MRELLIKAIATGLFSGYVRPFPGTWGTIPAWLLAYFVLRGDPIWTPVATVVLFGVSVVAAGAAERLFGHDARKIVIDEWAGMLVAVLLVPYSLTNYLLAFVAFRFFDVVKIPPARQAERLPGGWGVTMDDIVAGVQANLFVWLIILARDYLGRT